MIRVTAENMCEEAAQHGKPTVTGRDTVVPLALQTVEKAQNQVDIKLRQTQAVNWHMFALGSIVKEQTEGVAVALQRALTAAPCPLQIIDEERFNRLKDRVCFFHGIAGSKPRLRRNFREAAVKILGVARR